ncbi:MAG: dihydroorotate dehydrogenase electron transfer subunit [Muribaculaceae bacterium]|nr:dihydroorotate dehydrogenase electron transfer subunit [Muribaculaceae bacterium]
MTQLKKYLIDMVVTKVDHLGDNYVSLWLKPTEGSMPEMRPGQFVELKAPASSGALLRRPISVNDIDGDSMRLLIRRAGKVTSEFLNVVPGDIVNTLLPLGNGWSIDKAGDKPLLIGGGVGVAPLLYLGRKLNESGIEPTFLLGARTADDLLELDDFTKCGSVLTTTEDGSHGEKGFVTNHRKLLHGSWSQIYCCGPEPMMKAVGAVAHRLNIPCEVSLENTMACGLGACLCCVQSTIEGHRCVCTDGPVFNIDQLLWQD